MILFLLEPPEDMLSYEFKQKNIRVLKNLHSILNPRKAVNSFSFFLHHNGITHPEHFDISTPFGILYTNDEIESILFLLYVMRNKGFGYKFWIDNSFIFNPGTKGLSYNKTFDLIPTVNLINFEPFDSDILENKIAVSNNGLYYDNFNPSLSLLEATRKVNELRDYSDDFLFECKVIDEMFGTKLSSCFLQEYFVNSLFEEIKFNYESFLKERRFFFEGNLFNSNFYF